MDLPSFDGYYLCAMFSGIKNKKTYKKCHEHFLRLCAMNAQCDYARFLFMKKGRQWFQIPFNEVFEWYDVPLLCAMTMVLQRYHYYRTSKQK